MAKLKKQLAEKEKALAAELEAHQSTQNKVKELRTELNNEKHLNRQREEGLNGRLAEIQSLNTRLQVVTNEKENYAKQLQQVSHFIFYYR
jgi:chromosome segregation ATPase